MEHLTEEQLVAHYYGDADAPMQAREHLIDCAQCSTQFDTMRRVLQLVKEAPVPERSEEYGTEVWNRLRWKLGSERRRNRWLSVVAVAAMFAFAFFAGVLWRGGRNSVMAPGSTPEASLQTPGATNAATDRLVLVVVGDHLEASERVLLEVANADPGREVVVEGDRATDLVLANRIYRQTASQRGDERVATLLADLEPILIELSNAGTTLEGKKLAEIQKRIESKGLLFKVRVMGAQATDQARPVAHTDTL
jgi:hypothetical protein